MFQANFNGSMVNVLEGKDLPEHERKVDALIAESERSRNATVFNHTRSVKQAEARVESLSVDEIAQLLPNLPESRCAAAVARIPQDKREAVAALLDKNWNKGARLVRRGPVNAGTTTTDRHSTPASVSTQQTDTGRAMTPERQRQLLNMSPIGIAINQNDRDPEPVKPSSTTQGGMTPEREAELLAMSSGGPSMLLKNHRKAGAGAVDPVEKLLAMTPLGSLCLRK